MRAAVEALARKLERERDMVLDEELSYVGLARAASLAAVLRDLRRILAAEPEPAEDVIRWRGPDEPAPEVDDLVTLLVEYESSYGRMMFRRLMESDSDGAHSYWADQGDDGPGAINPGHPMGSLSSPALQVARWAVIEPAGNDGDTEDVVPEEVHQRGWQWRPTDKDTAFAPPFGTIRQCRVCGCLVAGGPTACARCAEATPTEESQS